MAYRAGVTKGITAPRAAGFLAGLSAAFGTGAAHKLAPGALVQGAGGLHVTIAPAGVPSVSTQIAALRRLLLGAGKGELGRALERVRQASIPLLFMPAVAWRLIAARDA